MCLHIHTTGRRRNRRGSNNQIIRMIQQEFNWQHYRCVSSPLLFSFIPSLLGLRRLRFNFPNGLSGQQLPSVPGNMRPGRITFELLKLSLSIKVEPYPTGTIRAPCHVSFGLFERRSRWWSRWWWWRRTSSLARCWFRGSSGWPAGVDRALFVDCRRPPIRPTEN